MMRNILIISIIAAALAMGLIGGFFLPFVLTFALLVLFPLVVGFGAVVAFRAINNYMKRADQDEQESHTVDWDEEGEIDWVSPAVQATPAVPELVAISPEDEIMDLRRRELDELIALMPSDSVTKNDFTEENGLWHFKFHCRSSQSDFTADGYGATPRAAFKAAEPTLLQEIREWHAIRESDKPYISGPSAEMMNEANHIPTALVIDDDEDTARATASLFEKMGCRTIVASDPMEAHSKIIQGNVDFIVLDWLLGEKERGAQVVERANRFIESFGELKHKFSHKQPKIVTYSVLDKSEIDLPQSQYFSYYDHWRKPFKYKELADRTSQLVSTAH